MERAKGNKMKGYVTIKSGTIKISFVISTSRRNLYTLNRGKISPAGRNDKLLIKLSILSVVDVAEKLLPMCYMFSTLNGDIAK